MNSLKRSVISIYIEELAKQFDDLKKTLNDSETYIWTYFDELKRTIDLDYSKQDIDETENEIKMELNKNWLEMIDKISEFENECKSCRLANDLIIKEQTNEKLNIIEEHLAHLRTYENSVKHIQTNKAIKSLHQQIKELIHEVTLIFGKLMFLNTTIVYLSREEHDKIMEKNLAEHNINDTFNDLEMFYLNVRPFKSLKCFQEMDKRKTIGKLIFIRNEYLGDRVNVEFFIKTKNELFDQKLSSELFKLKELKVTELNSSQIQDIQLEVSKVDMSEKNLKIIDRNLFAEFKNLKFLYLAHNQLQNIDGSLFEGLENLTVINLAYNQIKHIEKNAFRFLSNIEEINLKRNQLKEIDKFVFKNLNKLKKIYLNGNLFEELKLEVYLEKSVKFISFKKHDCIYDILFGGFFFRNETQNDLDSIIKPSLRESRAKRIKLN